MAAAAGKGWQFVQNGTTGIVALESIIVSDTLAIFFDRATNDPLEINGHPAWGALYNLETNTASPLNLVTDSFCGSGSFLSNGTMVSVGGHIPVIPEAQDGRMGIRIWEPCDDPNGVGCSLFEDPETLHMAETRWYDTSLRIFDGSLTGYAALGTVKDPIGNNSNADHPAFTPSIYSPDAPLGKRISNEGMPTTDIARVYHSSVTLTQKGNIMIAGSNPNVQVVNGTKFHSEFRVEYLNPPYMTVDRPQISNTPKKIAFNTKFHVDVSIPSHLRKGSIKVALIDLGFSSHAFHSSSRLVFMEAQLSKNGKTLAITSPPNNRVYPPGPGYIFLTVDDVTSPGVRVIMGNGASPPVEDQGIRV
ncbi:hypothetical protein AN958_04789 [Leucoagaricus sp. SymC.cos]|nr:hypothetical protein AN958_04789 [Leucoagaricus sp. SymC.cos]